MYRVFESLDELVQTVEQAYGVPMTSNCMVPRNEMLALLDDLRNAQIAQRLSRSLDGCTRGLFPRVCACSDQLDDLVDALCHGSSSRSESPSRLEV